MSLSARVLSTIAAAGAAWRGEPSRRHPMARHYPSSPSGPTGDRKEQRRRGRQSPMPVDQPRFLRADVEAALHTANGSGELRRAAQIAEAITDELTVRALCENRFEGLVSLPRKYQGSAAARVWLEGEGEVPGAFDDIFPPEEIALLMQDRRLLGVGVAQWVHPDGDALPHLVRLDPQFLRFSASEECWKYQYRGETTVVRPGCGWVLATCGREWPWRNGHWFGLGLGYVSTIGAALHRDGFIWKFANPAVAAVFPQGASEEQKLGWYKKVLQWGLNSVWGGTPGYDIKIFQPRAEGREVFNDAQDRFETGAKRVLAGTEGAITPGPGFANAAFFGSIMADKVKSDGKAGSRVLSKQALPELLAWAAAAGVLPPDQRLVVGWDTTPPLDLKAKAEAHSAAAKAKTDLRTAGFEVDDEQFAEAHQLPVRRASLQVPAGPPQPALLPEASTPDARAEEETAPTPDRAEQLAQMLTDHQAQACGHGNPKSCQFCGVRKALVPTGPDTFQIEWYPITAGRAAV